ncbi:MAG: hypothetical protein AB3N20_04405 [Rhizobiaceae bacterium]
MKGLLIAKAAPVLLVGTAVLLAGSMLVLLAAKDNSKKPLKENEYFG